MFNQFSPCWTQTRKPRTDFDHKSGPCTGFVRPLVRDLLDQPLKGRCAETIAEREIAIYGMFFIPKVSPLSLKLTVTASFVTQTE